MSEKKQTKDLAPLDYTGYEGQGYEGQTADDIMIPLLRLLQPLSPEVVDGGAKPGTMVDSVTGTVVDELVFVPALTQHRFVEWVPRKLGGGFRGLHMPDEPAVLQAIKEAKEFGKYLTPDGNELGETFYVYAVTEAGGLIVVPFTSTKIKVYKRLNTRLRMFQVTDADGRKFTPPMFAHRCRLTSVGEENAKGKYFNFKVEPARGEVLESLIGPDHPLFKAALELRELVAGGLATAAFETDKGDDDKVPF